VEKNVRRNVVRLRHRHRLVPVVGAHQRPEPNGHTRLVSSLYSETRF
jgi:hypothetical protein